MADLVSLVISRLVNEQVSKVRRAAQPAQSLIEQLLMRL